jgi:hypothetical protein
MPKVSVIERTIERIEEFQIEFQWPDGSNVRGDYKLAKNFSYKKKLNDNSTVNEWIKKRFKKDFSGFEVVVKNGDGNKTPGNTILGTVRASY